MATPSPTPEIRGQWREVFTGITCLIGLIASLHGFALYFGAGYHGVREQRFHEEGVSAVPTIVRRTSEKVWVDEEGWAMQYWIHYQYADESGTSHQAKNHVTQQVWEKSQPGTVLPPIEYARSQPTMHRPAAQDGHWRELVRAGITCNVVGFIILAISYNFGRSKGLK